MSKMFYPSLSSVILSLPLLFLHAPTLKAQDAAVPPSVEFFQSGIDYWKGNDRPERPEDSKSPSTDLGQKPAIQTGSFPWNKYLDPKHKEFFKEGEYSPPEPFMEIVRNPTDSNLRMWFAYMDKRNELSDRLQKRMREYVEKNRVQMPAESVQGLEQAAAQLPKENADSKRYRFRLYFDSKCPHCKRMFGTLTDLQNRGYYVEGVQADNDVKAAAQLPFPTTKAAPGELSAKDVQSVPVLFVGDLKKQVAYRISGYLSTQEVLMRVQQEDHPMK